MLIRAGEVLYSQKFIFKSFNLSDGTAEMLLPTDTGSPIKLYLPLTLGEFELGMFGMHSFVHPTDLPTSHPNFVTWANKSLSIVTHNRTGERCYLKLGEPFHYSGEFALSPTQGAAPDTKTSLRHTHATAKKKLEEKIGNEISFRMKILAIVMDGVAEDQALITQVSKKRLCGLIFTSTEWPSLASMPLEYVHLSLKTEASPEKKKKWHKKAAKSS